MRYTAFIALIAGLAATGCSVKEPEATAPEQSGMTTAGEDTATVANTGSAGTGEAMALNVGQSHPNGTSIKLLSIRSSPSETVLTMEIDNQKDSEVTLNGFGGMYLFGPDGSKLKLQAPKQNEKLEIPPGQRVKADLVFSGKLVQDGPATLIVNDGQQMDNSTSSYPGFRIPMNLNASAFFEDGAKKKSGLRLLAGEPTSVSARSRSTLTPIESLKSDLGAKSTVRGTVVALSGDVLFDFDKSSIRDSAKGTLDKLAQLIAADPGKPVLIEGYTDSKGEDAYNRRLSLARAEAVRDYLERQSGVAADRLTAKGLGESSPVGDNATDAGQQKNRRVEVVIGK